MAEEGNMKTLRMIGLASALALSAGVASGSTWKFDNTGSNTTYVPGGFERILINNSLGLTPASGGTDDDDGTAATAFIVNATNTEDTSITKNFLAWCLDFTTMFFNRGADRTETDTLNASTLPAAIPNDVFAGAQDRIQRLYNVAFDTSSSIENQLTRTKSAAFQLAIWEAVFDDDWDVENVDGRFWASSDTKDGDIIDQAQRWLTAAESYGGSQRWVLSFYTTSQNQDVVTAAPIPLPAAGWLLLAAIGGLGVAARRKRKMAA
jgi:hypothetical protein